jgi:dihydroorotate dehydrogenase (NAD+) catalytic subunit
MCVDAGVNYLHMGNSMPGRIGSLSGRPLKKFNLKAVEQVATKFPGVPVVGGGGIRSLDDVIDYHRAGATFFSVATIWFRPLLARRIIAGFERWSAK